MIEGFTFGILLALLLNCLVLYILTIMFPSHGTFRQYAVLFIAESIIGYQDMRDDIMSVVSLHIAKPQTTPKQRMNGLLDSYFSELQKV